MLHVSQYLALMEEKGEQQKRFVPKVWDSAPIVLGEDGRKFLHVGSRKFHIPTAVGNAFPDIFVMEKMIVPWKIEVIKDILTIRETHSFITVGKELYPIDLVDMTTKKYVHHKKLPSVINAVVPRPSMMTPDEFCIILVDRHVTCTKYGWRIDGGLVLHAPDIGFEYSPIDSFDIKASTVTLEAPKATIKIIGDASMSLFERTALSEWRKIELGLREHPNYSDFMPCLFISIQDISTNKPRTYDFRNKKTTAQDELHASSS